MLTEANYILVIIGADHKLFQTFVTLLVSKNYDELGPRVSGEAKLEERFGETTNQDNQVREAYFYLHVACFL